MAKGFNSLSQSEIMKKRLYLDTHSPDLILLVLPSALRTQQCGLTL
jgi:hypothetical protein